MAGHGAGSGGGHGGRPRGVPGGDENGDHHSESGEIRELPPDELAQLAEGQVPEVPAGPEPEQDGDETE